MDFPYTTLPLGPSSAFPHQAELKRPVIDILLRNGKKAVSTRALIDSGADHCIFPASFAKPLGITLPNHRFMRFSGTSNFSQTAYFDTIQVAIWNSNRNEEPILFDLYAGFCDSVEHVGLGILGQEGFFSRFKVILDHPNNIISIL